MGIVRDLYYARKMSAGLKLPAPTVALLIKRLRLAAAMGGGVEKTVSGSPAHITDALAKAALSVLASIEPIQDLHGYDHPWPAGGGKNICPPDGWEQGQLQSNGTVNSSAYYAVSSPYILLTGGQTYTLSRNYPDYGDGLMAYHTYDLSKTHLSDSGWKPNNYAFTPESDCYIRITTRAKGQSQSQDPPALTPNDVGTMFIVQLERGSTATSWEPYENICPISGLTGLSVYRTGRNLFDKDAAIHGYIILGTGQEYPSNTCACSDYIPVKQGMTLYCSPNWISGLNVIFFYDSGKQMIGKNANNTHVYTTPDNCCYIRINMLETEVDTATVNYPSTATTYEPYNGNTYAVDWTTEAGTVYGGTLDVVTGVLTVDRAIISSYAGETLPGTWISDRDVYAPGTSPTTGAQVVYELATPLTYQLSAQEVQMLLGENNVWSSSGDTVSVTYYAEGNANPLQSLNILLGGRYSNPKTADDVSDKEALDIILGGNK